MGVMTGANDRQARQAMPAQARSKVKVSVICDSRSDPETVRIHNSRSAFGGRSRIPGIPIKIQIILSILPGGKITIQDYRIVKTR